MNLVCSSFANFFHRCIQAAHFSKTDSVSNFLWKGFITCNRSKREFYFFIKIVSTIITWASNWSWEGIHAIRQADGATPRVGSKKPRRSEKTCYGVLNRAVRPIASSLGRRWECGVTRAAVKSGSCHTAKVTSKSVGVCVWFVLIYISRLTFDRPTKLFHIPIYNRI